jgi:hypothetical protein
VRAARPGRAESVGHPLRREPRCDCQPRRVHVPAAHRRLACGRCRPPAPAPPPPFLPKGGKGCCSRVGACGRVLPPLQAAPGAGGRGGSSEQRALASHANGPAHRVQSDVHAVPDDFARAGEAWDGGRGGAAQALAQKAQNVVATCMRCS